MNRISRVLLSAITIVHFATATARGAVTYKLDNGSISTAINASDGTEPRDDWFANLFTAQAGGTLITRVDFGVFTTAPGSSARVAFYRVTDPGGNPALGATLVYSQAFTPLTGDATNAFLQQINITLKGVLLRSAATPANTPFWVSPPPVPPGIWAVTKDNDIVHFTSSVPGTILEAHGITGLVGAEEIRAIDWWNGTMYALGSSSRLYTIDPATGAATQVGSGQFSPLLDGQSFGMDNGPSGVVVVSDLGQNLIINRTTGAATAGPAATYAAGDPHAGAKPQITALAYDPVKGIWHAGDSLRNSFASFNPATGVLNTIGPSGIDFPPENGLDVSPAAVGNIMYMASPAASSDPAANLYSVDKATGILTLIGLIGQPGDNILVRGLTVVPQ